MLYSPPQYFQLQSSNLFLPSLIKVETPEFNHHKVSFPLDNSIENGININTKINNPPAIENEVTEFTSKNSEGRMSTGRVIRDITLPRFLDSGVINCSIPQFGHFIPSLKLNALFNVYLQLHLYSQFAQFGIFSPPLIYSIVSNSFMTI